MLLCVFLLLRWDTWPRTYFADELIPLAVVHHMEATGSWDTNWAHADWHGDYAGGIYHITQYNFSSYHVTLRVLHGLASVFGITTPDLVFFRGCSVLFQLLAVVLVMHGLWRTAGRWAALAAGGFLAVMPQSVIDAHYARPETFLTLLVAVGLWCGWQCCQRDAKQWCRWDAVSAGVWGFALACKVSVLPMVALAWVFLCWRGVRGWPLLGWWALLAVGFCLGAPAALLDPAGFLRGAGTLLHQYRTAVSEPVAGMLPSAGVLFAYLYAFFSAPVWVMLLLPVWLPLPRRQKCLVYAAWLATVGYLLLFAAQQVFFERNLSHLLPLWAVLFGLAVAACSREPTHRQTTLAVLLAMLLAMLVLIAPARLSHGVVQTFFRGSTSVADMTRLHEQPLLQRYRSKLVVFNPMQDPGLPDRPGKGMLLRVMQIKQPVQRQINQRLQEAGWIYVSTLHLPLGELPYNQLQINHAPPGYDYYIKPDDDIKPGQRVTRDGGISP